MLSTVSFLFTCHPQGCAVAAPRRAAFAVFCKSDSRYLAFRVYTANTVFLLVYFFPPSDSAGLLLSRHLVCRCAPLEPTAAAPRVTDFSSVFREIVSPSPLDLFCLSFRARAVTCDPPLFIGNIEPLVFRLCTISKDFVTIVALLSCGRDNCS